MYRRDQLKTLILLQSKKSIIPDEKVNQDQVKIIQHVLDMYGKSIREIMKTFDQVFMLEYDEFIDEELLQKVHKIKKFDWLLVRLLIQG